ncbi:MAG: ABC transporter substrate-binding protein [Chloroflexi bacterium]|nr:ABC transporter substrate-binding protein [Chloroflexota bacterium]
MRLARLFTLLFVLVLLSAGALQAQDEKVLVVGHAESTDSLDPARGYTQTTGIVNQVTYDTLVTFPKDSAATIEPRLAESWTISDDGLTYTFMLRDAKFANGDAVTADDVVFSLNRLKNVKGNPSYLTDGITSIEATDAKTVTITLAAPSPVFLSLLANGSMSVTDAAVVKANGGTDAEGADTADTAGDYLDNHSAGSGPYMLDHWTKQTETVLVRNPNYWGTAPYFDRIVITNIPEAATQKTSLEAGDIDLALDLTSDQLTGLKDNPDVAITSTPGNIIHFLLMNEDPDIGGPMANPDVQQAVRLSLDYEGYKALWGGITPATNLTYGFAGAYGEDKANKRDIEAAKALLTKAGYPDGFDVTLSYPIFTFQGVNMDTNAQKIQADLKEVGINVTLNGQELQVELDNYRNGKEAFGYWFWGPDFLDPADVLSFLPGEKVGLRAGWTAERGDQSILDLDAQAKVETDPAKRTEIFDKIQDYLLSNGPFAPFIQPNVQTAYRSDITGYYWHPQWLVDLALLGRSS